MSSQQLIDVPACQKSNKPKKRLISLQQEFKMIPSYPWTVFLVNRVCGRGWRACSMLKSGAELSAAKEYVIGST